MEIQLVLVGVHAGGVWIFIRDLDGCEEFLIGLVKIGLIFLKK